ncbi:carboxypeptidase regulatory-like domain-containing protein [Candidatus Micrarchaeota archaeon]|nr:carboxypeptidase regulatory-like domain-containing protein [Candidatus Micrarchaeota archaeon]
MSFLDSLREQYDNLVASLEEKGLPAKFLIPLILLVVIAGVVLFFVNPLQPTTTFSLTITSTDGSIVPGASVALYREGELIDSQTSDSSGRVTLTAKGETGFTIQASARGYKPYNNPITTSSSSIQLEPASTTVTQTGKTVTVKVVDSTGRDVSGAQVFMSFEDGNARSATTGFDGFADVQLNTDASRASVTVTKDGYQQKNQDFSSLDNILRITLDAVEQKPSDGNLVIKTTFQGQPIEGVTVSLRGEFLDNELSKAITDATGKAVFYKIEIGSRVYASVSDSSNKYLAKASSSFTFNEDMQEVVVELEKPATQDTGKTIVKTVDSDGLNIDAVEVSLYDKKTKQLLDSRITRSGKAEFELDKGSSFYATLYKDGFEPASLDLKAGQETTIKLIELVQENAIEVSVTVTTDNEPEGGATVSLLNSNGFPLGVPSDLTGPDGVTSFLLPKKISGKAYKIYAEAALDNKKGTSDLVDVADGIELFIALKKDPAVLKVKAIDFVDESIIKGAVVTAYTTDNDEVSSCTTEENCELSIPSEKDISLTITAPGYSQTTSELFQLLPGETKETSLKLIPSNLANQAQASFEGLFDANGNKVAEVQNGLSYTAKFLVSMPSGTQNALFYLQAGEKESLEEDNVAITNFDALSKLFYTGTTASEACSLSETESSEASKFVAFAFEKGFTGAREFTTQVLINPQAKPGEKITFSYRLSGTKANVPFTLPQDEELIDSLLQKTLSDQQITQSDFCNGALTKASVPVSASALQCNSDGLCYSAKLSSSTTETNNGLSVSLGDSLTLKYQLFSTTKQIDNIVITEPDDSFEIISQNSFKNEDKISFSTASIPNDKPPGEKILGEASFRAIKTTSFAPITISVEFSDGTTSEVKKFAQVTGKNELLVEYSPDELIVGLPETIKIKVRDKLQRPVEDARVIIFECESTPLNNQERTLLGDGAVGNNGDYNARTETLQTGSLGIRVEKDGYKPFEACPAITSSAVDFITADPSSMELNSDGKEVISKISVSSFLPQRIQVRTTLQCGTTNFLTKPAAFNLQDTQNIEVVLKEKTSFVGDCVVTFTGTLGKTSASTSVNVKINSVLPAEPLPACEGISGNLQTSCLTQNQGTANSCTPRTGQCDAGLSCFACEVGESTIPSSVVLKVSNNEQWTSETLQVNLAEEPSCSIQWLNQFDTNLPYYDLPPQSPAPAPQQSFYYDANQYSPQTNPWSNPNYFNYQQQYPQVNPQEYDRCLTEPSIANTAYCQQLLRQSGQQYLPPYCQQYTRINPQTTYGYYNSLYYQPAINAPSIPQGACDYPQVCGDPQACSFLATGSFYGDNTVPIECRYPSVCQNTNACSLISSTPQDPILKYKQSSYPVKVEVTRCTKTLIEVTATYTGDDYFKNGGLGGTQNGYVLVTYSKNSQPARVSVLVNIAGITQEQTKPVTPTQPQTSFPVINIPVQPNIPLECLQPQRLPTIPQQAPQTSGEYTLPTNINLLYNAYTKSVSYSTPIKSPIGAASTVTGINQLSGITVTEKTLTKLSLTTTNSKDASGVLSVSWPNIQSQNSIIEVPINVQEDSFTPQAIAFFTDKDVAAFEQTEIQPSNCDFSKVKSGASINCKDGLITATLKNKASDLGFLTVKGFDDLLTREIPIFFVEKPRIIEIDSSEGLTATKSINAKYAPECIEEGLKEAKCDKNSIQIEAEKESKNHIGFVTLSYKSSPRTSETARNSQVIVAVTNFQDHPQLGFVYATENDDSFETTLYVHKPSKFTITSITIDGQAVEPDSDNLITVSLSKNTPHEAKITYYDVGPATSTTTQSIKVTAENSAELKPVGSQTPQPSTTPPAEQPIENPTGSGSSSSGNNGGTNNQGSESQTPNEQYEITLTSAGLTGKKLVVNYEYETRLSQPNLYINGKEFDNYESLDSDEKGTLVYNLKNLNQLNSGDKIKITQLIRGANGRTITSNEIQISGKDQVTGNSLTASKTISLNKNSDIESFTIGRETYKIAYRGNYPIQFWTNWNPRYYADFYKISVNAPWTNGHDKHLDCFPEYIRISSCPNCPDIQRIAGLPAGIGISGATVVGASAASSAAPVAILGTSLSASPPGWVAITAGSIIAGVGATWQNSFDAILDNGAIAQCHQICVKNLGTTDNGQSTSAIIGPRGTC